MNSVQKSWFLIQTIGQDNRFQHFKSFSNILILLHELRALGFKLRFLRRELIVRVSQISIYENHLLQHLDRIDKLFSQITIFWFDEVAAAVVVAIVIAVTQWSWR